MRTRCRWGEFFEGNDQRLSMTRLLCFMSFFPSSFVLLSSPTENMLLYYLASFGVAYIGGKSADAVTKFAKEKPADESTE